MPEYNYSPLFLKANEELVRRLVELAKTETIAVAKFEDYNEAKGYRTLILNLKRSLGMNHPEMAYVHNNLRTEIGRDETGFWEVYVGVPPNGRSFRKAKGLRGAKPERLVQIAAREEIRPSGLVKLPRLGLNPYDKEFMARFMEATRTASEITTDEEQDQLVIDSMKELPPPGWILVSEKPFILKRNASANVALDSGSGPARKDG